MSLIEIVNFLFLIFCGFLLGRFCWIHYGFSYGVLGFLVGMLAGFSFLKMIVLLSDIFRKIFPQRPICESGKCGSKDYTGVYEEDVNGRILMCKCGNKYLKDKDKFMKFSGENVLPYMRKSVFGKWEIDQS